MSHVVSSKSIDGAEGVEVVVEGRKATVSFSRKVSGPKQYESSDCSVFIQADVDLQNDSDAVVEEALNEAAAVAKKVVFKQLGLSYQVDERTLVIVEAIERDLGGQVVEGSKPATPTRRAPAKKHDPLGVLGEKGEPDVDPKDALWRDLASNPNGWFDNTQDKRSAKAPDYKAKNTNKNVPAGSALWIDSAPEWFEAA